MRVNFAVADTKRGEREIMNSNISKATFRRITEWEPAYNRIAEGYGRHGMNLRFVLVGEKGAVQFMLFTNWLTSADRSDNKHGGVRCSDGLRRKDDLSPMPADLGYHSLTPMYEDQRDRGDCAYLDGRPCYYDGGLRKAQTRSVDDGGP
jgi:hypothetical protein